MKHFPTLLTGAVEGRSVDPQADIDGAYQDFLRAAAHARHKRGTILKWIYHAISANTGFGAGNELTAAEILATVPEEERHSILGNHTLAEAEAIMHNAVERYQADNPIEFADSNYHIVLEYIAAPLGAEGLFCVRCECVASTARLPLRFIAKPDIAYAFKVRKRRQLHTLDRFSLMRNIYAFAALTTVNLAILVIVGISIKLVSIAYLTPAAYALYYIYNEAMFLTQKVRIEYNIYSKTNHVKLLTYSADQTQLLIRRGVITAACPICSGSMTLYRPSSQFNGRITSRCSRNLTEHVWSFDPVTFTGAFLN